jgi:hypothetical protein
VRVTRAGFLSRGSLPGQAERACPFRHTFSIPASAAGGCRRQYPCKSGPVSVRPPLCTVTWAHVSCLVPLAGVEITRSAGQPETIRENLPRCRGRIRRTLNGRSAANAVAIPKIAPWNYCFTSNDRVQCKKRYCLLPLCAQGSIARREHWLDSDWPQTAEKNASQRCRISVNATSSFSICSRVPTVIRR